MARSVRLRAIFVPPKPPRVFRVPAPVDGLQTNCCKNPHCENFGIPAKVTAVRGNKPALTVIAIH